MVDTHEHQQCSGLSLDVRHDRLQVGDILLQRHAGTHVVQALGDHDQVRLKVDAVFLVALEQAGLGQFLVARATRRQDTRRQATIEDGRSLVLEVA